MTSAIVQKTARILRTVNFGTLATSADDVPWAAPVSFAYTPDLEIIYISSDQTLHAKHNLANPHACFAVYDTQCEPVDFDWVKLVGNVHQVPAHELDAALDVYFERRYPDPHMREELRLPASAFGGSLCCFALSIKEIYTMDMFAEETDAGRRVTVEVDALRDVMRRG